MPFSRDVPESALPKLQAIAETLLLPREAFVAIREDTKWQAVAGSQAAKDVASGEFPEEDPRALLEMPRLVAGLYLRTGSDHLAGMAALLMSQEYWSGPGALARAAVENGARAFWVLDPEAGGKDSGATGVRERSARALLEELATVHYARQAVSGLAGKDNDSYRTLTERRRKLIELTKRVYPVHSLADDPSKWTIEGQRYERITVVVHRWGEGRKDPAGAIAVAMYDYLCQYTHPQALSGRTDVSVNPGDGATFMVTNVPLLARMASAALAVWFDGLMLLTTYHGIDHPSLDGIVAGAQVLMEIGSESPSETTTARAEADPSRARTSVSTAAGTRVGPEPPDELTLTVNALLAEVDRALTDNRWVFLVTRSGGKPHTSDAVLVRLYAAAGLRHCCALLSDVNCARVESRETAARLAARAHLETWFTATYIHRGGYDALAAVDAAYQQSLLNWEHANATYRDQLQAELRKVRAERRSISKNNRDRQRHNQLHPDHEPLQMVALPPLPNRTTNDIDVSPALADSTGAAPAELPLTEIVQRLNRLVVETRETHPSLEIVYDHAYRFLSTYGAHPTLPVLDSYISGKDRNFLRLAAVQTGPPMALVLTEHALMFTASLAQLVLGSQGHDLPVADGYLASIVAKMIRTAPTPPD